MKADIQLERDVIAELHWDPAVTETEIAVTATSGIVTLAGAVPSYAEKVAARRAAERITGVRVVADDLVVAFTPSLRMRDTEIAHAVAMALSLNVQVPETLRVSVRDGWMTLEGTVAWQYQRDAAMATVRVLAGVRGVTNCIVVTPAATPAADTSLHIVLALRRSAELDSKHIVVQMVDGEVTLRGTVRSWAERYDAERAAWSAPGVRAVVDRLCVAL